MLLKRGKDLTIALELVDSLVGLNASEELDGELS
jgi:hypothetical protein